ncbi:hypothetical protein MEQU1_000677 [Malassezia equina]|uniref:Large ribosomal subunit protein mL46 n=1 Tax=Malassezia equina TaxID=1381935 RepID=A0AAF0J2I5_9BASI|nr:hypothetical protein MEQU1_000677 [Malassezia equina]
MNTWPHVMEEKKRRPGLPLSFVMVLRVCGTRTACVAARPRHGAGIATSAVSAAAASLQSALLVSRAPVVLQEPSPLEREYYRFNVALSNRLQQPFAREQYFKKGSAAESRFDEYYAQLQNTWDVQTATKTLHSQRSTGGSQEAEADMYATMPRETQADAENNVQSLERALDRTLYLVVKRDGATPTWHLPTKALPAERAATDSLHATATEAVTDILGAEMDLWLVSHLPIAVLPNTTPSTKTYILKAHILSGTPSPSSGTQFAWLTREELQERWLAQNTPDAQASWAVVQDLLDA